MQLLRAHWQETAPVRALTITAQQLLPDTENTQEQLLRSQTEKHKLDRLEHMEKAMQHLRGKYGRGCIAMGYVEYPEIGLHQPGRKDENLL